tara:strand:- start:2443 stop:3300 length:858 start_codon:yes stop_codon:yes gene_type:complete
MNENYFTHRYFDSNEKNIDMNIHRNIYKKLDHFLKSEKVPNLLFHGSSGSGKRTIVNYFINKIYDQDKYKIKQNVMIVNCSHGKGIKFIREDLKFFAKVNIQSKSGENFKTIVLINADFLTTDAQSALRRCIEQFSKNTRFFIIVENKDKLLVPILSRFCEIYVPEYSYNSEIINLHQKYSKENYDISVNNKSDTWLSLKVGEMDIESINHEDLLNLVGELYDKSFSCLDIMNWLENQKNVDEEIKKSIKFYYEKIKIEYRSEPLLMFTILDYLFLRKEKEICFE